MKTLQLLSILSLCFIISSCWKHDSHPTDKNGLPAATQSGANTLGFLLNGEPLTSLNKNGSPELWSNYDPFYYNGVLGVSCYWKFSESDVQYFGLGVTGDMNIVKTPATYTLTHTSLYNATYHSLSQSIELYSTDDTTYCSGSLTLTKFDTAKGIVSGTFNVVLASPHTDTLRITDGRFDIGH